MYVCVFSTSLENFLGEQSQVHKVLDLLVEQLFCHRWNLVFESSLLDGRTVNGKGVIVEKLLIEIRAERGELDSIFFAHIAPRSHVVIIGSIDNGSKSRESES